MTTPPLYARYLAADPASGFPGAWQTSTAPFDGARLYELKESENEMKVTNHEEALQAIDEVHETIAALAAANIAQAQRIKELEEALEGLQYYCNNPSAWETYDDEMSKRIQNACEVGKPKFWMSE